VVFSLFAETHFPMGLRVQLSLESYVQPAGSPQIRFPIIAMLV
jgi:hypothetical protein